MARVTPEQAQEMAALRESGWSYDRIGARFGVTSGTVHYQCLRMGAISPRTRPPVRQGPPEIVGSNGVKQRRFTPEEDAEIRRRMNAGEKPHHIAKALGRASTSTRVRMMTLALREDGYAEAAQ